MRVAKTIKFKEDTYHGLEFIAKQAGISVIELVSRLADDKCEQYKLENGLKKIPLTDLRKLKLKSVL